MQIQQFFEEYPSVAIACSGGVDSLLLVALAKKYAKKVKAYLVKTEFQPEFELEDARKICEKVKVELQVISISIVFNDTIVSNTEQRCYYCKHTILEAILNQADKDGLKVILDGTNATDDSSDRPGMRALKEMGILSPLRICGYSKARIRQLAEEFGLSVYDKPSYACLATRIPTGTRITMEKLESVNKAETYLLSLGFRDFRVRYFYGNAKIQIQQEQLQLIVKHYKEVEECLQQWFNGVVLDLKMR